VSELPKITCPSCSGLEPAKKDCKTCGGNGYIRVVPTS